MKLEGSRCISRSHRGGLDTAHSAMDCIDMTFTNKKGQAEYDLAFWLKLSTPNKRDLLRVTGGTRRRCAGGA